MSKYRTFLVPYDFSTHSEAALATAAELAERLGAELHLVHVVQPPAYAMSFGVYGGAPVLPAPLDLREVRESALSSLREVAARIGRPAEGVHTHVVEGAGIADMIREVAGEIDADLIVMGTHGRTGLAHAFLGSAAERTLRRAPCPVLTVQAPEDPEQA